jgi:hypothetical protein
MMREVQPCAQFTRARQYGLAPDPPESPALPGPPYSQPDRLKPTQSAPHTTAMPNKVTS